MEERNRIPEIRFKGFNDDWEQRKLGDIGYAKSGVGFPDSEQGGQKGIPFFKVSDMNTNGNENELMVANNYVTDEQIARKHWNVIYDVPAIFFAKVGAAVMLNRKRLVRFPFLLDNNTMAYVFEKKVWNCDFGKTLFETIDLTKLTQVGALPSYNSSDIESIQILIPKFEEQTKIGQYFSQLDNLITLHQRKHDNLVQLKKSMLSKMFPQGHNKIPNLRFNGFTDDWEQRKLESLCDVFTDGDWIEAKDQSDSGIRLVQTGNVGTTEYLDKKNNKKWISEETFERLHCEEIYEGDILISRLPEPAGRACIVPDLGVRMITAVDCTIVRTTKEYDSKYLVQYLSTPMYFKIVNSFLGGGTRQRISRGNLSGIDIPIPSTIEEQWKIGEFFSNLDHLITLHQRKVDKLKTVKKSMLSKMFVK